MRDSASSWVDRAKRLCVAFVVATVTLVACREAQPPPAEVVKPASVESAPDLRRFVPEAERPPGADTPAERESAANDPSADANEALEAPGTAETLPDPEPRLFGMGAKEIEEMLGKPKLTLPSTEGEACFLFEARPTSSVCFEIDDEQAPWSRVRRRGDKVLAVRPLEEGALEHAEKVR